MAVIYTDTEIAALIAERKIVTQRQLRLMQSQFYYGYGSPKEIRIRVRGSAGGDFLVILNQKQSHPTRFSVILAVQPVQGGDLFRLRRYDGRHRHTNQLVESTRRNKVSFYDFHIHTATERYQENDLRHDGYAEVTDRYRNIYGAVNCLVADAEFYATT